jgi:hypothetical protein
MLGRCVSCGKVLNGEKPAVSAPPHPTWQPFVQDIRSDDIVLRHPACFVRDFGVDALIAAVRREDLRRVGRLSRTKKLGRK